MSYPNLVNPDLLSRIPLTARTVLDVGCSAGATLAAYRHRNPRARLFGIEADATAANLAMTRLDEVAIVDVEQTPRPFGTQRFDCIVYGDSLEHLRDPWAVLADHAGLLNPEGVIAICVPNVEHWSIVHRLLTGAFDYENSGLLDRTHLRWFTVKTMQAALRNAGLYPVDVAARIFDPEAAAEFANTLAPALAKLGVDEESYRNRATPLQFVWRATATETARVEVVSTMLEPVGGVSHVRVIHPMAALSTAPDFGTHTMRDRKIARNLGDTPRIYIFHRPCLTAAHDLPMLRELLAEGYVVVCEFDDHPDYLQVLQRPDILNFTGVHAVQTTTIPLATVLGERNPEIGIFPNGIDELRPPRNFNNHQRLTMLFGGINRENEWPDLMPALNDVLKEVGERIVMRVVADQGFYDALETPHKEFVPFCDYDTYLGVLAESEICLMPLRDNPFNRCKSDLKFIEASAARVTSIASPVVYGDSIVNGQTGYIFHSPAELQQQIRAIVADPWHALMMADAARQYVRAERMLAYQISARQAWYRSLWERREALTEALYQRIPALRRSSA